MKIYVGFTYSEPEKYMGVGDMVAEIKSYPPSIEDIQTIKDTIGRVCKRAQSKAVITSIFQLTEDIANIAA